MSVIENLKNNGFDAVEVATKAEALEVATSFIFDGCKVGIGGSVSTQEIGLLDYLAKRENITFINQYEAGISMEENVERRRNSLLSDVYFCGCNAITEGGFLVNIDGSGNRVAAMIYGPKKVVMIVGKNKIVKDFEAADARMNAIAIPKNIERLELRAKEFGKERKFAVKDIARKFSVIQSEDIPGRITIVLVNEDLGY